MRTVSAASCETGTASRSVIAAASAGASWLSHSRSTPRSVRIARALIPSICTTA